MAETPDIATILPQDCPDMPTLRGQIDRVDRALVALMTERLGYISRAAEIKQSRAKVYDSARIEDVVAKVRVTAAAAGLPPDLAEAVWRELVSQSIAHEFRVYDTLGKS